jgi:hypothetical protein
MPSAIFAAARVFLGELVAVDAMGLICPVIRAVAKLIGHVLGMSTPSQVARCAIGLVSVEMASLHAFGLWAMESNCDEGVQFVVFARHGHCQITLIIRAR